MEISTSAKIESLIDLIEAYDPNSDQMSQDSNSSVVYPWDAPVLTDDEEISSAKDKAEQIETEKKLTKRSEIDLFPFLFASITWLKSMNTPPTKQSFIEFKSNQWKPEWIQSRHKDTVFGYIKRAQLLLPNDNIYYNIVDLIKYLIMSYYYDPDEHNKIKSMPLLPFDEPDPKLKEQEISLTKDKVECLNYIIKQINGLIDFFATPQDLEHAFFGLDTSVGRWYNWSVDGFIECGDRGSRDVLRYRASQGDIDYNHDESQDALTWSAIKLWYQCGQSYE